MLWTSLALSIALHAAAQENPPGPVGFRSLELDAALAAARAEDRVLLVDFFDADSTEWQVMQKTTWQDPVITRWLDARLVAVQYDIRTHQEAAKQLGVVSAPTCLFLTGRGYEIDRVVGLVEARPLMTEGQSILRCGDRVADARILLANDADNPDGRLQLAIAYLGCGRQARALQELLWLWDHGGERPDYRARRLDELPRYLSRVVLQYPAAREPLVQRRDAAQAALENPTEGVDLAAVAADISALNTALGAERKQLQLFERFLVQPGTPRPVVEALFNKLVVDALVRDKRWDVLLAGRGDVSVWLDREYIEVSALVRKIAENKAAGPAESEEALMVMRNGLVFEASSYVEALCSTGATQRAKDAIDVVLLNDPRMHSHQVLIRACVRGKALDLARAVLERAPSGSDDDAAELEKLRKLLDEAAKAN